MRITFTAVAVIGLLRCALLVAEEKPDHIAQAKEAEQSLHRACDAWEAAKAAAKPTTQPATEITRSYFAFIAHAHQTKYIPNEAVILPEDIVSAGVLKSGEHEMSYFAGSGQSGLVMSAFHRTEWTKDHLPNHGFLCSLGIEPQQLKKAFKVTEAEWADKEKRLLRLHYVLDGQPGVIEVRQDKKGWEMHPDRGVVKPGDWWQPYADAPATRPAE